MNESRDRRRRERFGIRLKGGWASTAFLLFPDEEFAAAKFRDHRQSTAILFTILVFFLPSMWFWDYVIDPVGARTTVSLRLAYFTVLPLAVMFWFTNRSRAWLAAATLIFALAAEALLVAILARIENGMVFGIGGFMYCMLLGIVGWQCFSLTLGLTYTFLAAILPHVMAWGGYAPGFQHVEYGALLWPAVGVVALTQVVLAHQYLQRFRLQQQLEWRSNTDPLTGVSNRRHFMPLLEREVSRARRLGHTVSLLVLDIDHFKPINDTWGHPTGDEVIRDMAAVCGRTCRGVDVVARIGGEEFAVLLPECDLDRAIQVAERIREAAEGFTFAIPGKAAIRVTVSVGVAELTEADGTSTELFSRADAALYAAKGAGRNRVVASDGRLDGRDGGLRQFEIWPAGIETAARDFPAQQGRWPRTWNQRAREDFRIRKEFQALTGSDQLLHRLFFGGSDPQWGTYGAYLEVYFSPGQGSILVVGCGFHGAEDPPCQSLEPLASVPIALNGNGLYATECTCRLGFGWFFRAVLEQRVAQDVKTWELLTVKAEIGNTKYRPLPHAPLQAPSWLWEGESPSPLVTHSGGASDDVLCPACLGLGYRLSFSPKPPGGPGVTYPWAGRVGCIVCGGSGEEQAPWRLVEHPELADAAGFLRGSGTIHMARPSRLQVLKWGGGTGGRAGSKQGA